MAHQLILNEEKIASRIFFIRGEKVLLDFDLATLYDVENKNLKRAVKRNIKRFPNDFMFQLSEKEYKFLIKENKILLNNRSKYMPYAFTEQGLAMLSGILNSERAINVNIAIMRTFVRIRKLIQSNQDLTNKLAELEKITKAKFEDHDKKIKLIFDAIAKLINQNEKVSKSKVGFYTQNN